MPNQIPASQQFRAVAHLRWRLFINAFRRKGQRGEIAARLIAFPVVALLLFGVVSGAATTAYHFVSGGDVGYLAVIFWAIFVLQVVVSINISPPGLSFDPESLIRFPLSFPRYLAIRLILGLLSASNVVGTLAMLAAASGAALATRSAAFAEIAQQSDNGLAAQPLIWTAFGAALCLSLTNMLFVRMVFAWVDRWLSTRRAREFLTGSIILFSVLVQYLNVTFNGLGKHQTHAQQQAKIDAAMRFYHYVSPILQHLPPGLGASAVVHAAAGQAGIAIALLLGILCFAALFLAVFGWRMQREYRGENLSEVNHARDPQPATAARVPAPAPARAPQLSVPAPVPTQAGPAKPPVDALLLKEWTYIRRNPAQFYGVLLPLVMVIILRAPLASMTRGVYAFPSAAVYCILGVSALAYNVLGLDGNGVQLYFLSPVPFRTIFLAKNLFGFAITMLQVCLLYAVLCYLSGPPPLAIAVCTVCWVVLASLINATVGNIRSVTSPKKIDPSKLSRKQASQMSALLALAIMLIVGAVGVVLLLASRFYGNLWLPVPVLICLIVGAAVLYMAGLGRLDDLALRNRETLIEELSKAT